MIIKEKKLNINAVDLFCGVGGLTNGVQASGINVVAGYDIDKNSQFAYEYNNSAKFILKDVKDINDDEILKIYPQNTDVKVLMGCAPCQPFSSYSHMYRDSQSRLNKMDLLDYFGRQVELVKPDYVSMENVPQIAKEDVFSRFIRTLESNGYFVDWHIVYAPEYGVPQSRKRLLLLASKKSEIKLIKPKYTKENFPTVRDTIGNLPPLVAGEQSANDALHRSRGMSELNINRIKHSVPGGTWRDWPESLLPDAYRRKSGSSFGSVYGRLSWDKPSSTMTTQFIGYGNGRFGHPTQNRALSLREGALLQTFPIDYQFIQDKNNYAMGPVALQIGNAVPPKLGLVIGESIIKHANKIGDERNEQEILSVRN